jgi:hypothetical protein
MPMNISGEKLLRLLEKDNPLEVRCAAALVLGEIGPARDAEAAAALCEGLQDAEAAFRLRAIEAVGKLRVAQALPRLLERIKDGGAEAEASAHAAARIGVKGTRGLQELLHHVAPGVRRYIAAALATDGSAGDDSAALHLLHDSDPAVIDAAVRSLLEELPSYDKGKRQELSDSLVRLASNKKEPLSPASEVAVLRLLAALDNAQAADILWDRIGPSHATEVRAAALQGLGKWADAPGKEQLKRLFACASDADFRLAAPALVILRRLPAQDKTVTEWLGLMRAPDPAVRRLAVDKVGDRDTAEVAAVLLEQYGHADRGLSDAALARLTRLEQGRTALIAALLDAPTADRAWSLAKAQGPFARDYSDSLRGEVFTRACKYLEAADRRADPLLFLLREADATDLRDRMARQATTVRKKKGCAEALPFLRWLGRDPACGLPIRLELAACGLHSSAHDLTAEARAADPCLEQFLTLYHQHGEAVLPLLEAIEWLEPEDLFYLGFHCAEQGPPLKKFAGAVLSVVVKRSPRSKTGQAAKSKLRSTGLE